MVNIGIKSKRVSVVVIFIGWNINMDISRWTFAASARWLDMLAAVSVLCHCCEHLRIDAVRPASSNSGKKIILQRAPCSFYARKGCMSLVEVFLERLPCEGLMKIERYQ